MKVYIQCDSNGFPFNETVFNAYDGFKEMGFEIVFFNTMDQLRTSQKEDIIVGGLGPTKQRLNELGFTYPELDYPEELNRYLGRKIWKDKINHINSSPELWPVFVKPYIDKIFTGRVVREPKDLIGCGCFDDNYDVICSEVINIIAEWRVYVRYGEIIDVRPYKGNWEAHYDPQVIKECIRDYTTQPAGYAIDFGITVDGKTVLIEVNDGFSIGSYGLSGNQYAKLLSARWAELTGTKDECNW